MEFRLFGFDVEIKMGFWITSVILGLGGRFDFDAEGLKHLALWVPVVLVSVLVHELGHALAIRRQGVEPTITLHWMGGLTAWREILPMSRPARVGISLAGPMAGFLLWLLLLSMLGGTAYFAYKLLFWHQFTLGIAPIAIGMFFLGSLQLLFMGIIGEYIGNIHTQVHNRPLVVERERLNFQSS